MISTEGHERGDSASLDPHHFHIIHTLYLPLALPGSARLTSSSHSPRCREYPHLASLGSGDSLIIEYAQCVKMLGNGRLEAKCQDGETRLGQIRGQMRKKVSHLFE